MSLWAIAQSPLIFGGDLPSNDAATNALITNPEVLAVNQRSSENRQALEEGNLRVWLAEAPVSKDKDKDYYLAVFNLGDTAEKINLAWEKVGFKIRSVIARDLWSRQSMGQQQTLQLTLPPHGSALYRLSETK